MEVVHARVAAGGCSPVEVEVMVQVNSDSAFGVHVVNAAVHVPETVDRLW